ncbi:hypothetical protein, partial [Staphylococcus aureus]|uniref:hypothetical protein n=1 Tax=Staphylococcus aureus TaxID=1280 RepID=UPI0015BD5FB1
PFPSFSLFPSPLSFLSLLSFFFPLFPFSLPPSLPSFLSPFFLLFLSSLSPPLLLLLFLFFFFPPLLPLPPFSLSSPSL